MKYIKIDENSRFICEDRNYTLEYRVPKGEFNGKKGVGFRWETSGYFATIDQLLQDWVINAPSKQNDDKIKELKDVIKCIQDAEAHITKLIHK